MHIKKRHKTHHKHEKGKIFAWLALITGLGSASFWTIFPLVAKASFPSETNIGIFFALISVICLFASLTSTIILNRVSRVHITKLVMIGSSIVIFLFIFVQDILQLYLFEVPRAIFTLFIGIVLSLYVRDNAERHNLGMEEGRYYLYANIGWLIGPLIGGFLGEYVSRDAVFLFSSLLYLISFFIFEHQHIRAHPVIYHKKEKSTIKELVNNVKDYFKEKELRKVFIIALGMNYWWAISSIYIPIYIINHGFGDHIVGYVVAGGMLPLVLLEAWVGKAADKHNLRIFIGIGFLILAGVTMLFEVVSIIPIVLVLMAVVDIGGALIEPLQETYLFKVIKKKDENRFYGVYNISDPVANIVAPLIASVLIFVFGMAGLWYGSAALLVLFSIVGFSAKY